MAITFLAKIMHFWFAYIRFNLQDNVLSCANAWLLEKEQFCAWRTLLTDGTNSPPSFPVWTWCTLAWVFLAYFSSAFLDIRILWPAKYTLEKVSQSQKYWAHKLYIMCVFAFPAWDRWREQCDRSWLTMKRRWPFVRFCRQWRCFLIAIPSPTHPLACLQNKALLQAWGGKNTLEASVQPMPMMMNNALWGKSLSLSPLGWITLASQLKSPTLVLLLASPLLYKPSNGSPTTFHTQLTESNA